MRKIYVFTLMALISVWGVSAWALDQKDGVYQISTGEDLVAFSELVNGGENTVNAVLAADIDMTATSTDFLPIGSETHPYSGIFDGQGRHISNLKISLTQDRVGLFGVIQSPAVIKNLILDQTCQIETSANYAGIIGSALGTGGPVCMENMGMEGDVHVGGKNAAGIIGNNQTTAITFRMKNCYMTGNVTAGTNSALLTAWTGDNALVEDCWGIGEVLTGLGSQNEYFVRGLSSGSVVTNCYSKYGTQVPNITDEQATSGELCYLLNGNQGEISWYQTLGQDVHPVLDATHNKVYTTAEVRCDGIIISEGNFTNDADKAFKIPAHKFEGGFCTVCGLKQEGFMKPDEEGFYNISDGDQLVWFANAVNNGENASNARLTDDINMSTVNTIFCPIGSEGNPYSGTFDGQGHRISNLNISLHQDFVGLFGVIKTPAVIKNLIVDESCNIEGGDNYCGMIGIAMSPERNGDVYLENLGMEGNITLSGKNGAGIIGSIYNHNFVCHLKNCYVTGNINSGGKSALLVSWAGDYAIVEDCWGIGEVQTGLGSQNEYFVRGLSSGTVITNCYSKYGTQLPNITDEQVLSGALCYLLNGKSFINPLWFQTIGEDMHPVWDSIHGIVYKAGEEYGDVHDDASFVAFKNTFLDSEKYYCEEVIAEKALIDQYAERIENMEEYKTMKEYAAAYNEFVSMRKSIESSAKAYAALQAKADEVIAYLEEYDDFEGEKRNQLEYYLTEYEEPNELYPNGTILYIMETHTMNEDEVKAEAAHIDLMLEEAIATGFRLHSDITTLLTNADFSDGYNGWEGKTGTATNSPCAECKNSTCDFHQTLTELRNGVYEVQVNGFFRPGNPNSDAGNLTSTNYGAFFYVNGMQNYLMAPIEGMIGVNEAVDGENCFITEGAAWTDYSIYDDSGELMGYVPGGQGGLKIATKAGRYQNRILVNVTDGLLTLGFRMPGTGVANDLMDIANVRLFYHGTLEDASAEIDATLQGMVARAQTLVDYKASYGADYAQYPNYSAELRESLRAAIEAVGTTSDVEGKYALVGTFSDLFQQIYENKKLYIGLMDEAETLLALSDGMVSVLSEEEVEEMNNAILSIYEAYMAGTAKEGTIDEIASKLAFLPPLENGVYQIGNGSQLTIFSTIVNCGSIRANAILTADINMASESVNFRPIGSEGNPYSGTFDGQGHRISNLNISLHQDFVGLFGVIKTPAVIKNLIVDESCNIEGGDNYCGMIGIAMSPERNGDVYLENLGMEGNITLSGKNGAGIIGSIYNYNFVCHLKNCYVTGNINSGGKSALLVSWAGDYAIVEDCWGIGEVQTGLGSQNEYFVRGLSSGTVITNCYSKYGTQVANITDEQLASGELCYLLNGDQSEIAWYQTIGEDKHPVLDPSHNIVVKNEDGSYANITGIGSVRSSESIVHSGIFDLSGRKVSGNKLNKGIYIMNGKKVLIK